MIYKLSNDSVFCYVISLYEKVDQIIKFTPDIQDYFEDDDVEWDKELVVEKLAPEHTLEINFESDNGLKNITHTCEEWEAIYGNTHGIICQSEY